MQGTSTQAMSLVYHMLLMETMHLALMEVMIR